MPKIFLFKCLLCLAFFSVLFLFPYYKQPVFAGNTCVYKGPNSYVCGAWDQCGTGASCGKICTTSTPGTVNCGGGSCTYQCPGEGGFTVSGRIYEWTSTPGVWVAWQNSYASTCSVCTSDSSSYSCPQQPNLRLEFYKTDGTKIGDGWANQCNPQPYYAFHTSIKGNWIVKVVGLPTSYKCDYFSFKGVNYPDTNGDCQEEIPNVNSDSDISAFVSLADTTPPACGSWTFNPTSPSNANSISVTTTATDSGGGVTKMGLYSGTVAGSGSANNAIVANNYDFTPTSSASVTRSWDTSSLSSSGTYVLASNWWDVAGNFKQCRTTFTLDKTSPTSQFTSGPTQVCLGNSGTYNISASDNDKLDVAYFTYSPTSGANWMKTPFPIYDKGINWNIYPSRSFTGTKTINFTTANGFTKGSSYYFASGAIDKAGNKCSGNQFINSWPSGSWYYCGNGARKTVNVVDSPNAPTLNTVSSGLLNRINLSWTDNSNDEKNFTVYRNGSFLTTLSANATSFVDTTAICDNRSYSYQVFANNVYSCGGNGSVTKNGSCKTDNPTTCGAWTFSPVSPSNTNSLSVTARASDADGFQYANIKGYVGGGPFYYIYNKSSANSTISGTWNTSSLSTGVYQLDARWQDNNGIYKTCPASYGIDKTPPSVPGAITANPTCGGTSGISWGASADTGAVVSGLKNYRVRIDEDNNNSSNFDSVCGLIGNSGDLCFYTTSTSFNYNFKKGKTYKIWLTAFDNAGNESSAVTKTVTVYGSSTAPTLNSVSSGILDRINLVWTDNSTDETSFSIYRDGQFLTSVGTNTTSFTDTTSTCNNTLHNYYIVANNLYNSCGGNVSATVSGSCKTDNPTTCGAWTFSPVSPSKTTNLQVTTRASDADGLQHVLIRGYTTGGNYNTIFNGANTTGVRTARWNTSSFAALPTGIYQLTATWKDNNNFNKLCQATYGIDKTPPSVPGAITANPTCGGTSGISWGASADTGAVVSGLDHYILSIDQDNNGSIDLTTTTTAKSYNTYNFLKGKTYKISVVAVDKLGNQSTPVSKIVTVSSDPAKPVLTATVDTSRNVTLSWPALGYGASSYTVSSGTTISCTSSTCTSSVPVVSCGNHSYTVTLTNSCGYTSTSGTKTITAGTFVSKPNVTATRMSQSDRVKLSWGNDANATSYTINGTGTKSMPSCSGSTCSTIVTGLSCSRTYSYTVTATNACGSSFNKTSDPVSIKPNCAPSCSFTGGTSGPYNPSTTVSLISTSSDDFGISSYTWSTSGGSFTGSTSGSKASYVTANTNNAYPAVTLTVTDANGANAFCSRIIGTKGIKGTQTIDSGTINRSTTDKILLTYKVRGYNNKDKNGNSINATATINKSGSSICNSVANCAWTNSAGNNPKSGKSITIASGNTTAYVLVTLKNPGNLRSGDYTFPVNFVSSVGNTTSTATVRVSNRAPTCTITGINNSTLYPRNKVIPITLTYSDADGDSITAKSVSTSASCGTVSALSSANKANYTTPNVNGVSCFVNGSVTDSQGGTATCTPVAIAHTKLSDITVTFSSVGDQGRNVAPLVVPISFTTFMENDQNGTATVNTSTNISIGGVSYVNLCKSGMGTCTINNSTVTNGTSSKTLTVTLTAAVLQTLSPAITYGAGVNITAPHTNPDGTAGVLNGSGGTTVKFNNSNPTCPAPTFSKTAVYGGNRFALNDTITLTANATDPDGDTPLTYTWNAPSNNGTFSNISTNKIDYKTASDFSKNDTYSYTVTDGKGGSCTFNPGLATTDLIGTEAATQINSKIFEVQATGNLTDSDICNAISNNGNSNFGIKDVVLTDKTYNFISDTTNNNGNVSGLNLKNSANTYSGLGSAGFNISNLPTGFSLLSNTCVQGLPSGTVPSRSGQQITLSGVKRDTSYTVNIPVKFSPNPYVVTQQGDMFSGAGITPVLKRPVIINGVTRLISDGGFTGTGILQSQSPSHSKVGWAEGDVDFTSKKGVTGVSGVKDVTTKFAQKFSDESRGIFKVIEELDNKGQLGNGIIYSTSPVTIDDSNYNNYKGKILIVNGGGAEIVTDGLINNSPLELFILATGKIDVKNTSSASTATLVIKGALISGITANNAGTLNLDYQIKVNSSANSAYKNPSIKVIFDPSIYLKTDINGVKVLEYVQREIN